MGLASTLGTVKEVLLESDLIRRAQTGDIEAFDRLVARHGRLVLSMARTVTRQQQDAEDVAQEAFLRLYRALDRIDPERPLEAWLVRVTINAARSYVSRNPARSEEELDPAREEASASPDPGREFDGGEVRDALNEAIKGLTLREREVFLLRDVQEIETSIIAEALGISSVTVRRLSSTSRTKVQAWFIANRPEHLADFGGGSSPTPPKKTQKKSSNS